MQTELTLNGSNDPAARYLGWTPVPAQLRLVDAGNANAAVDVTVRNRTSAGGGALVFATVPGAQPSAQLALKLPPDSTPVDLVVSGLFPRASTGDRDTTVEVVDQAGTVLGSTPVMVRIRKDATTLTTAERDRFVAAFAAFNNRGMGRFRDFRNVHTAAGDPEAHGRAGFLPWHRAFLLDLERELQAIDASVALPYWRFDRPARSLFTRDFMGVTSAATGTVQFSPANPLQFWATDGVPGIARRPQFDTRNAAASSPFGGRVIDEIATLRLGGAGGVYAGFRAMEGNPHGTAHVSFSGSISSIPTAAKDPLFFLLHANVDRLWAKWQWANGRFSTADPRTFSTDGDNPPRVGHRLGDTMWPWNGVTTPPRPSTAPGGTLAPSPLTAAPGLQPRVDDMVDYQGVTNPAGRLGVDYDDVPFG
jgi:tyrosinase